MSRSRQKGSALVLVAMMSVLILIFGILSTTSAINAQQDSVKTFRRNVQAVNVAKAGIQDAIGWFKRQEQQPVSQRNAQSPPYACPDVAFNPKHDSTDPSKSDTDDESVGIVRDSFIGGTGGNLFGRYIVRKRQSCSDTSTQAVRDISIERGKNADNPADSSYRGEGISWYIESEGIIYQRNNANKEPDELPNRILDRSRVGIEINRISITTPVQAPVLTWGTTASNLTGTCDLLGDLNSQYARAYRGSIPGGSPRISPIIPQDTFALGTNQGLASEDIFAVSESELFAMSDKTYSSINEVERDGTTNNRKIPLSIAIINNSINFTTGNTSSLNGSGVLYVNGDLTIGNGIPFSYTGLVYVKGTLTLGAGSSIAGAVVANRVVCNPSGGRAYIEYSSSVLNLMRRTLGLYRENNMTYKVLN
jgi:type II secretory pathway pseudopilin PulG